MTKSTITREQLEEWVAQFDEDGGCDATDRQLEALIRQSLAAMDSEPVIIVGDDGGDALSYRRLIQSFEPGTKLYRHAQQPVVESEPVAYIFKHPAGRLFWSLTDESNKGHDDVMPVYAAPRPAMVAPVCTCPSGDGSLRWPCPVHAGNSLVIPDGSASMLRRWLAFGRGMQNAGCQLPHNLIAETEAMLAAAQQEGK
ncbi:hypothetical protein [Klebsiella pneumoniae]|uniref:hypothetical protein n=1 Tax=Klebsiella pneumoniae TaxID=573 RepID=UPI000E2C89A8|nr:Uncharacterised protein [Klebsiella pneumoniae]